MQEISSLNSYYKKYMLRRIIRKIFYQKSQKINWYYMPWKWEHQAVLVILSGDEKILEASTRENLFYKYPEDIKEIGDLCGEDLIKNSNKDA